MAEIPSTTLIYYTANAIPESFAQKIRENILKANLPIISVSQKPIDFGENICVGDIGRSPFNIYKQALIGAKAAKTKYIAMAEDDILYSPHHFTYKPPANKFMYNMSYWCIYTWKPDIYSYKGRRNTHSLICERDLFIEAIEERFAKWPDPTLAKDVWGEPGRYDSHLKVTPRESDIFYTPIPNIAFSHETALSFEGLGTRKRVGYLQAFDIPHWGRAYELSKIYV